MTPAEYLRQGLRELYGQDVVPASETFETGWTLDTGLGGRQEGHRIADHFDPVTRTLFEGSLTGWSSLDLSTRGGAETFQHKLVEATADVWLLQNGRVGWVVWFGPETIPNRGNLARIFRALGLHHTPPTVEYHVIEPAR